MKNKIFKLTILFFFILIFIKKDIMYYTIYETTMIWYKNIVPNLFPMFIITSLIINSNLIINICNIFGTVLQKLFKCSNYSLFVFLLSLFTGSPSNAKNLKDLLDNNLITHEEANKTLLFTTNYNPLLIYSIINTYLNKSISITIILIIIITNIIIGITNRNMPYKTHNTKYINNNINISNIIKNTIDLLLMILGTLILFNIIINILPINNILFKNIINGFIEITTSLSQLKYININTNYKIILTTLYLAFGGLSIHIQIKSILPDTNYKLFLKSRLLAMIISTILIIIVLLHNRISL